MALSHRRSFSTFASTGTEKFYLNGIQEAGVNGFPKGNVENRYFTWQPRVGFTYDLTGNGKTVFAAALVSSTSAFRATTCTTPL